MMQADIHTLLETHKELKESITKLGQQLRSIDPTRNKALTDTPYKILQTQHSKARSLLALVEKDKGLTFKKIGEELGISAHRARDLYMRALRILRKEMENCDESKL